ncbi:MAG: ATP-binding protein [Prevotellaceae bacterium]|jgi:hypothetical protein|nr:ATP-binding protein [Prevotellaceae bacterium]
MKQLPIGIQSFRDLRENDYLYVDKTAHIHRIVTTGKVYFLSRPRRFGKSLLISTMDELFRSNKPLFEGLYIYDKWDWTQQYPVIRIDWTRITHSTPEKMEVSLCGYLRDIAKTYQVDLTKESSPDCFDELIRLLREKTGKNAVILIDEYDKPVTAHLFDSHLEGIRTAVHNFYQVMKGADDYLQLIFLTGVSKFSGLSVFSALNNPSDITMDDEYASICGYTQEELENCFSEYIDAAAAYRNETREELLRKIRYWYDGYTWDGQTSVYNPFSTLYFFKRKRYTNYWFRTGTPTFLIDILQRREQTGIVLEPITIDENLLDGGYDPQTLSEIPLFFQTGYLTVKRRESTDDDIAQYTLGVPNMEVNKALLTQLLLAYGKYPAQDVDNLRREMEQCIREGDESGLANCFEVMMATVPFELQSGCERYYHTVMLIWMRLIGFKIQGEKPNNRGRADAVWEQPGLTVVAELKYHAEKKIETLLNEAMTQIHDRRYYNLYLGKVLLLGVAFSGKEVGCRMEKPYY